MSKKQAAPAAKKSEYPFTCVYTGRRLGRTGKVFTRFELPDGKEMHFAKVKGCYIGHTYRCGKDSIPRRPERVDSIERKDNPEWEAADALVDARNRENLADRKIANLSKPHLKAAIAALIPLCRRLDYYQRKALIEYLAKGLTQKGKEI